MTMLLNSYDVDDLVDRLDDDTPNLKEGAARLQRLVRWTNANSDGWAYWRLPCNASAKLQRLLASADRFDPKDCTKAELNVACSPIKAFLTKRGVDHEVVFTTPPPQSRWVVTGPDLTTGHEVPQDSVRAGLLDMVVSDLPGIKRFDIHLDSGIITYERTPS